MPKTINTRAQRAHEVRRRIERGPPWSKFDFDDATIKKIETAYRIWSQSWIVGEIDYLIPELRK